ncbi:MAG: nitronate monooxygenase [Betaproteobacteria bacterium]|jgi:NAD(P)H-dependent flavin oxidoreductase YrpB (nitropropane dioxygenase family)|nr:nitronate monooxygenase [Betaproteobacteria bacterium]
MKSELCRQLGIDFPLFAFSHCRDVVVEVSKAGGLGVFGAVDVRSPEALEAELNWIDEHIEGKPYGVDFIVPAKFSGQGTGETVAQAASRIPVEHKIFARKLLAEHGIDTSDLTDDRFERGSKITRNIREQGAQSLLDVAFNHPIALVANALGPAPPVMIERAREAGVLVAALVGSPEHAIKQAQAGVDIIVAAGTEAGGHCGEVGTIVLVPEVLDALHGIGSALPVLAAGGIVTGRQMAACMAMGAAGAWTGSVWLTTTEAETSPVVKEKMLAATSAGTIRSRSRTGKFCRQLRSDWTDAWEQEGAPKPLPMPLQSMVSDTAMSKVLKLANGGHEGARKLASYFVGQGVGLMNATQSTRSVVMDFMSDYLLAVERLQSTIDD